MPPINIKNQIILEEQKAFKFYSGSDKKHKSWINNTKEFSNSK